MNSDLGVKGTPGAAAAKIVVEVPGSGHFPTEFSAYTMITYCLP